MSETKKRAVVVRGNEVRPGEAYRSFGSQRLALAEEWAAGGRALDEPPAKDGTRGFYNGDDRPGARCDRPPATWHCVVLRDDPSPAGPRYVVVKASEVEDPGRPLLGFQWDGRDAADRQAARFNDGTTPMPASPANAWGWPLNPRGFAVIDTQDGWKAPTTAFEDVHVYRYHPDRGVKVGGNAAYYTISPDDVVVSKRAVALADELALNLSPNESREQHQRARELRYLLRKSDKGQGKDGK